MNALKRECADHLQHSRQGLGAVSQEREQCRHTGQHARLDQWVLGQGKTHCLVRLMMMMMM